MSSSPRLFDRALLRRRLARAAPGFATADFIKRRAAQDVVERLEPIMREFPAAVDLSARGGAIAEALTLSDAAKRVGWLVQADLDPALLPREGARLVADEERLPFAEKSFDLVLSTLSLHWANDLVGALIQARRLLKPDGLFIGALFGGGTLFELRQSLLQAEAEVFGGAGPRVSPVLDPADGPALLSRAGLSQPVIDVDKFTVRYAHPIRLMHDLRAMGETGVLADRPRPLTRAVLARMSEIYAERFGDPDGRFPASFEIVTLTGWAAARP